MRGFFFSLIYDGNFLFPNFLSNWRSALNIAVNR
jgi:hypothetical protein